MSNVAYSTPVAFNAETTFAENPHRGSSRLPFMNKITSCAANIDLILSLMVLATLPSPAPHASFNSPAAASSKIISQPPTSSPSAYT